MRESLEVSLPDDLAEGAMDCLRRPLGLQHIPRPSDEVKIQVDRSTLCHASSVRLDAANPSIQVWLFCMHLRLKGR